MSPHHDLPEGPLPTINSNHRDLLLDKQPEHEASIAVAYGNSDWATCVKTRRSFSSICLQLAGSTIAYKNKTNPPLHSPLPKLGLWMHATWAVCHSLFEAFYGALTYLKRPLPLHMKITMVVRQWAMPRNLLLRPGTLIFNTSLYMTGLSAISSILNGSTPQLILPIT